MKTALLVVIVVAAAACGGSKSGAAAPAEIGDSQNHAVAASPPASGGDAKAAVDKFHDTLAVRWHAEPSPQRMTDTCATIPQFRSEADAVAAAPAPGDAALWATKTKQLAEAVGKLDATCQAKDAAAFEPAFSHLHDAFHAVMEAGSAKGESGEHKH